VLFAVVGSYPVFALDAVRRQPSMEGETVVSRNSLPGHHEVGRIECRR
jgi:hypothetical protein